MIITEIFMIAVVLLLLTISIEFLILLIKSRKKKEIEIYSIDTLALMNELEMRSMIYYDTFIRTSVITSFTTKLLGQDDVDKLIIDTAMKFMESFMATQLNKDLSNIFKETTLLVVETRLIKRWREEIAKEGEKWTKQH